MAARKNQPATKKSAGKAMTKASSWQERMAEMAASAEAREPLTGSSWISIRNGEFRYGEDVLGDTINVVVLDFSFDNAYYDAPYDEDNPADPACFAVGLEEESLVPHENAPDPQAETCAECWANEFGSDDRQKGKACKNTRRLALVAVDEENGFAVGEDSEHALMRLPPTSLRYWKSYVKRLARVVGVPPIGVVTQLTLEPGKGASSLVKPSMIADIEDEESQQTLLAKLDALGEELVAPYRIRSDEEKAAAKKQSRRGGPAKKRAAAKKKSTAKRKY